MKKYTQQEMDEAIYQEGLRCSKNYKKIIKNRMDEALEAHTATLLQRVEESVPRYIKGGELRTQYFAKGWNECKQLVLEAIKQPKEK